MALVLADTLNRPGQWHNSSRRRSCGEARARGGGRGEGTAGEERERGKGIGGEVLSEN